ncbi:MAG: zinc-binding dehydrogenase [Anaerolineales bacterium]|nr:zinc-binding dehydrogenase [Anaerolineales bacterium]
MKAVLFHMHGGPQVLEYADFPTPEAGPGEALVKLHAAALNRMDLWVRDGWPGIKLEYPHIPGADGAGVVSALGPPSAISHPSTAASTGATRRLRASPPFAIGDRVVINSNLGCGQCDFCSNGHDNICRDWHLLGETVRGTYAEYVKVPARQLFKIPDDFDYHQAAAAALVYHTAWHSLVTRGRVQSDETVLIIGASGGVNTASLQIAKYLGAKVIVVGAGKEKLALAESLGADTLVDRTQAEDWSKEIYRLTDKRGVDVVVDNVGVTFPLSLRALRKGGRLLTVGNTGGAKFEIDNRFIFGKHLSIIGSTMGTLRDFETVMALVCAGKLKAVVDKTFPLSEARAAQERLEKGEQLGKITLAVG